MIITFLTGKRPALLLRTLNSFTLYNQELLNNSRVIILNNGGDEETRDVIKHFPFVNEIIATPKVLGIGEALSTIASHITDGDYWLSCEDDFECTRSGLENEVSILEDHPEISQVRLRRVDDGGLGYHMVTGKPLIWVQTDTYKYAKAHRTFNNNLTRVSDIPKCFPCTGERDAQRKWYGNEMNFVAQVIPGYFKHIGGDNSLRAETKCEP